MAGVGRSRGRGRSRSTPAKGVIWSRERARRLSRKKGGRTLRNSWSQTLSVRRDLAYDLDVRGLVSAVSVGAARYLADQMLKGERPDGFGPQAKVSERTKRLGRRRRDKVFARTGYAAEHWQIGKLKGSSAYRAERILKPYGGEGGPPPYERSGIGRAGLINVMLKLGRDFQSVRGKAKAVIWEHFAAWLEQSVGERPGHAEVRRQAGTLNQFR